MLFALHQPGEESSQRCEWRRNARHLCRFSHHTMYGAALRFPHCSFGASSTIRWYTNCHLGIPHDKAGSEAYWRHLDIQADHPLRDLGILVIFLQVSPYCSTIQTHRTSTNSLQL